MVVRIGLVFGGVRVVEVGRWVRGSASIEKVGASGCVGGATSIEKAGLWGVGSVGEGAFSSLVSVMSWLSVGLARELSLLQVEEPLHGAGQGFFVFFFAFRWLRSMGDGL